jgi:hypothetical protein
MFVSPAISIGQCTEFLLRGVRTTACGLSISLQTGTSMKAAILAVVFCMLFPLFSFAQSCGCVAAHPVVIGVNTQHPPYFDKAVAANLSWVRYAIRWSDVQPTQSQWQWTQSDHDIRTAKSLGLKVLVMLHATPTWANGGKANNVPASDRTLWATYVRNVVQRYNGSQDPLLRIDAYQIWNEPDIVDGGDGVGWNLHQNSTPHYADYVHDAALEIRTYGAGALVVAGAYSSREEWKSRVAMMAFQIQNNSYPEGPLSNFIDVLAFHANGVGDEYSDNATDRAKFRISEHANANPGTACKPKWITEYGYSTSSVTEVSQRDRIRRMTEMFAGSHNSSNCTGWQRGTHNVQLAFLYVQIDFGAAGRGIHRADGTQKNVVTHYLKFLPKPASDM